MGMTGGQILRQVEMPLAMGVIVTGVRVATVIAVGVTTIAAAVGAGGLGVYIFRGLRQYDNNLLLAGAIAAALLALIADFLLGLLEQRFSVNAKAQRITAAQKLILAVRFAACHSGHRRSLVHARKRFTKRRRSGTCRHRIKRLY